MCGEFAVQFAELIQSAERMNAVIDLNQSVLEVSEMMETYLTIQVIQKNFRVFSEQHQQYQLICGKDKELIMKQDKELSGGQKSMIALIITLAF